MKRVRKRFKKFDLEDATHVQEYEELLENILVKITEREKVIETEKSYSEEGVLKSSIDHICYLVHWEEQVI